MKPSPYEGLSGTEWMARTVQLVKDHPLKPKEIVDITLKAWNDIFISAIGSKPFRLGKDIFPKPQILAFFLHELIPLELADRYPGIWRGDKASDEKDLVYLPDPRFSFEIKTSSHPTQIFGNRSYAQECITEKKSKSGYYLAVNFEGFTASRASNLKITKIRFGWLDHKDWTGQKAATGQQARLSLAVDKGKLLQLYPGE